MAESSSQALERYLAEQLAGLKLEVPDEDVEFMARFVEEEGLEVEEKVEGVRGMLEGVVEVSLCSGLSNGSCQRVSTLRCKTLSPSGTEYELVPRQRLPLKRLPYLNLKNQRSS